MAKFFSYVIVLIFLLKNAQANDIQAIVFGFGILGVLGAIGITVVYKGIHYSYCCVFECCNDRWISLNKKDLFYELNRRMYGQHLASDIIYNAIKGHMKNESPKKALVLSFNGMTGVGKNYASTIIAEHIYREGFESKFVKWIIGSHDFKHWNKLERDKWKLKNWITEQVSECPRSLFIFDEVEKMNPELVNVLKPYLSHYTQVDGVDYRKSIFIFMGKTGADLINKEVVKHRQQKKRREDITIKQMDRILSKEALTKAGGFLHSTLLEHQLIDYFIPFLPLEKQHVKKCIEDEIREKKYVGSDIIIQKVVNELEYYFIPFLPLEKEHVKKCVEVELRGKKYVGSDIIVQKVVNELEYFPDDSQWFSESGCKKVASRVDQHFGLI